ILIDAVSALNPARSGIALGPRILVPLLPAVLLIDAHLVFHYWQLSKNKTQSSANLQNALPEDLRLIDPLTGLFDRQAVHLLLPKEVANANRHNASLTVLRMSLDEPGKFRSDDPSHERCLSNVANLLRNTLRGSDVAFRYGVNEFLVLLPDTDER